MCKTVSPQELELLAGYPSEIEQRDLTRYDYLGQDAAVLCRMKDRTIVLFDKRYQAARKVIDLVAKRIGIDPEDTSYWLYAPDLDGSSPIVAQMDEFFSRSRESQTQKAYQGAGR